MRPNAWLMFLAEYLSMLDNGFRKALLASQAQPQVVMVGHYYESKYAKPFSVARPQKALDQNLRTAWMHKGVHVLVYDALSDEICLAWKRYSAVSKCGGAWFGNIQCDCLLG